jgi:hypothetical protein
LPCDKFSSDTGQITGFITEVNNFSFIPTDWNDLSNEFKLAVLAGQNKNLTRVSE